MKIMTKKINLKITIEEAAERHPVPVLGTDYKVKIQIIEIPRFFVYKNGCRGRSGKFRFGGIKKAEISPL